MQNENHKNSYQNEFQKLAIAEITITYKQYLVNGL